MQHKHITIIGSANVDLIMKVPVMPVPGETVTDGTFMQTLGGKGANQAVAASHAGGQVSFVGCVGSDEYGQSIINAMQQINIDIQGLNQTSKSATGTAIITIDQQGNNCIAVAPGANNIVTPELILKHESLIAESEFVLMQMEIPAEANRYALELCQKHKTAVMFNYAPVRNMDIPVDNKLTTLVVNEIEAATLLGTDTVTIENAPEYATALRNLGPELVLITLGADGVAVATSDRTFHVNAFSTTPVDTTAAGDTFCGALAVALVEEKPIEDAVRFANAAAAISVSQIGAQSSIPNRKEIDDFLGHK